MEVGPEDGIAQHLTGNRDHVFSLIHVQLQDSPTWDPYSAALR